MESLLPVTRVQSCLDWREENAFLRIVSILRFRQPGTHLLALLSSYLVFISVCTEVAFPLRRHAPLPEAHISMHTPSSQREMTRIRSAPTIGAL